MSYSDIRNSVAIGVGGIISLISSSVSGIAHAASLLTESGVNLLNEDGGYILLD